MVIISDYEAKGLGLSFDSGIKCFGDNTAVCRISLISCFISHDRWHGVHCSFSVLFSYCRVLYVFWWCLCTDAGVPHIDCSPTIINSVSGTIFVSALVEIVFAVTCIDNIQFLWEFMHVWSLAWESSVLWLQCSTEAAPSCTLCVTFVPDAFTSCSSLLRMRPARVQPAIPAILSPYQKNVCVYFCLIVLHLKLLCSYECWCGWLVNAHKLSPSF